MRQASIRDISEDRIGIVLDLRTKEGGQKRSIQEKKGEH